MIATGLDLATAALPGGGRFALEAGIAGLHSTAPSWRDTDWLAVVSLYDRLVDGWPSTSARIARAIALAHTDVGPEAALATLDAIRVGPGSADARHLPAARARLLSMAGRSHEARAAYLAAAAQSANLAVARALTALADDLED